jgi:hypothetical protein
VALVELLQFVGLGGDVVRLCLNRGGKPAMSNDEPPTASPSAIIRCLNRFVARELSQLLPEPSSADLHFTGVPSSCCVASGKHLDGRLSRCSRR